MKAYGFENGVKIQKGDFDEWISTCGFRKNNWGNGNDVWGSNHRGKKPFARKYIRGAARQAFKNETKKFLKDL